MPDAKWKAGRYRCIVDAQTWKTVNGTDVLELDIRPNEGLEGQECHDEVYPRRLSIWFDDKVEGTIDYLVSEKLVDSPFIDEWSFVGKEIEAVCKYNAKGYDAWYFPRKVNGTAQSDPEAARRTAKKFSSLLKKKFPLHGVKTVDDLPTTPPSDGIPF